MDVNSNITGVHVKPGFHHEARYEFKVHFDGADFETLTYRVSFDEAGPDGRQSMKLHALTGKDAREDSAVGELVLEGRTGEPASAGGLRLWAGRAADSFYIDLSLLAKVNGPVRDGTAVDLTAWRPENAKNSFAGTSVESIVLEVSHQHPELKPGARIGVWCATKLATDAGGWRQINRGGHPMMWPIFWPDDVRFTNPANTRHPSEDFAAEGQHIARHIAEVVAAGGASADPQGYGQRVARELFPDVLPYVVGTPATYGFAGRNGRTLADNAPEVMLSLVAGTAVPSGLKPSVAEKLRQRQVPVRRTGVGPTPAAGETRSAARDARLVLRHRNQAARPPDLLPVQAGGDDSHPVRGLGHDVAPGVGDERVAVRLPLLVADGEGAGLGAGADVGLGLDRAGAEQHFPVVLAGLEGEGGGEGDDLGALFRQRLEKVGKAQVVADRAADGDALAIVGDDLVARLHRLALLV